MTKQRYSRTGRKIQGRATVLGSRAFQSTSVPIEGLERRALLASIVGTVFNDANGDGQRQNGEEGMAGWRVYLDQDGNRAYRDRELFALTDEAGRYAINDLDAGTYYVRQTLPGGFVLTTPGGTGTREVTLGGEGEAEVHFGNRRDGLPGSAIRGVAYHDLDNDHELDHAEAGVPGNLVYIDDNNNHMIDIGERSAETNAQGEYLFDGLEPREGGFNKFLVKMFAADGWVKDTGGWAIELDVADTAEGINFAVYPADEGPPTQDELANIRGSVFDDRNGNGTRQDGEPALSGWTVYLDHNNNGRHDDGEEAAVTNGAGNYAFEELDSGTFRVRQVVPDGWSVVRPADGVHVVSLSQGETSNEHVFANRHEEPEPPPPPPVDHHDGSIRGVLFFDANNDGGRNEGELALVGWVVYLDQNRNGHRDDGEHAALTNVNGNYAFEGLAAGEYRVREVVQDGWTVVNPQTSFHDVTLAAGQAANERHFTHEPVDNNQPVPGVPASIRGVAFNDRNGNGTRDDGEAGLGGRLVFLDQNENGQRDAGEHAAETGAEGRYAFEGLAAGSYRVRQVVPAGWTVVRPAEGFYDLELLDGQRADDTHFANRHNEEPPPVGEPPPAPGVPTEGEVAGDVFDDLDHDGVRDEGEPGVARARVFLDANANGRRDRREVRGTTDASGAFRLVGLAPGAYVVRHVAPKGFRPVATDASAAAVSVTPGGAASASFAVTRKALLQGTVFHDATRNRALDPGEGVQAGLTVFLDLNRNAAADPGEPTALTDAAGRYAFLVDRGSYRVGAVLPAGWQSSSARDGTFQVKAGSGRVVTRDLANELA
jgi:hypothetical protein